MLSNDAEELMDDGSDQFKKASPPAYAIAMQDAVEADEKRQLEAKQAAFAVNVTEGHWQAWTDAWEAFKPCLVAYLKGESSQVMVEKLQVLDSVIESVGFDSSLKTLNTAEPFPTYDHQRDKIDAAVCRLVIGVWAAIRFDGKNEDTLIAELDAVPARVQTEHVGFIKCVIEAGGLSNCPGCREQLTPSEIGRGRCQDCIQRPRLTLRELAVAIECEHRYDNKVYGDGFDTHFPEWTKWRRRLRECYGRDRSDWQLWEDWIGYAQEYCGIDQQQFLDTLRKDAAPLLPPLRSGERAAVMDEANGSTTDEVITGRKRTEAEPAGNNALRATEVPISHSDRNAAIQSLNKSARLAILAYDEASEAMAELSDRVTDRDAWEWSREHSDADCPAFETFARYLREARKKLGENKNLPRGGRSGGSIAGQSDL